MNKRMVVFSGCYVVDYVIPWEMLGVIERDFFERLKHS